MAKGPKKPTAKKSKAKSLPEAPSEKQLAIPGWSEAMKLLEEQARRLPQITDKDRAMLSRIDQPVIRLHAATAALPAPAVEPPVAVPAKRKRISPQVEQALAMLALLFPRDKYPKGVPVGTTVKDLVQKIERRSKIEAAQHRRTEQQPPYPKWDAVNTALKLFNSPPES